MHFIVHDDWPSMAPVHTVFRRWLRSTFGRVYDQASSRLCVSPYMEAEYRQRYGQSGHVLYPSRSRNAPTFAAPPQARSDRRRELIAAYAGSFYFEYPRMIVKLANRLGEIGGRS